MDARIIYNKTADFYDKKHENPTAMHVRKTELDFIKKYAKGRVVDIGCGTGFHLKHMKDAIGIDISENMLKDAPGNRVQASCYNIPLKSESFDTAICFNLLNICNSVSEMHRILKNNAILIVSAASLWDNSNKKFIERFFVEGKRTKKIRTYRARMRLKLFNKKEFIETFEKNGFKLEKFYGIFILQKPYWGWYRAFTTYESLMLKLESKLQILNKTARIYMAVFKKISPE